MTARSASSLGRLSAPPPPHTRNGHRVWPAMIYRRPLGPSCADLQVTSDEAHFSKRKGRKNGGQKKCKRICQSRGQATKPMRLPASSSLSCLRLVLEESVDLDGSALKLNEPSQILSSYSFTCYTCPSVGHCIGCRTTRDICTSFLLLYGLSSQVTLSSVLRLNTPSVTDVVTPWITLSHN